MVGKHLVLSIAVAALFLGAASCNPDNPDKPDAKGEVAILSELSDAAINGTTIQENSTVAGLIKNSKTGQGIPGVAVTDGYNFVKTDANGVYQMARDSRSRKIYYTLPADYEVALDPSTHLPAFYNPGILEASKKYRADFVLTPLSTPETEFTLLMIGDPQCSVASEVARYKTETIKDIKNISAKYPNCYAMTLGDITFDSTDMWGMMVNSMSNVQDANGWYVPFYQTIGNHDHNSLVADSADDMADDYNATLEYVKHFGPTDYSFDRGSAHIIAMDDIPVYQKSSSSKSNGYTWDYNAGFSDDQYKWFKQDIENVQNKDQKVGFLCLHIPLRAGASSGGASVNKNRHYQDFINLMKEFKEFHIMIGHTHYQQNYLHTGVTCKGGSYVYEHIHGAACGAWWAADCNVTGGPNGYTIYTIKGNNVTNWIMKGSNRDEDYQLRVYDGNQVFTGSKGYKYQWFTSANTYLSCTAKGFAEAKDAFVAEVFNDDKLNWKVEMWQNGAKIGDFVRRADGGISNVPVCAFWFNEKGKSTTTWVSTTSSHYWYYKPSGTTPDNFKNWEVRATQTIPTNKSQVNVYTCSELTNNYKSYDK